MVLVPTDGAVFIFMRVHAGNLAKQNNLVPSLSVDQYQVMCLVAVVTWGTHVHTPPSVSGGTQA